MKKRTDDQTPNLPEIDEFFARQAFERSLLWAVMKAAGVQTFPELNAYRAAVGEVAFAALSERVRLGVPGRA